jgi:hypothetical protein
MTEMIGNIRKNRETNSGAVRAHKIMVETEIQKLFPQSVQCFMERPDYDFSFFLTDDFFARKKKKQKQKHSKRL